MTDEKPQTRHGRVADGKRSKLITIDEDLLRWCEDQAVSEERAFSVWMERLLRGYRRGEDIRLTDVQRVIDAALDAAQGLRAAEDSVAYGPDKRP